MDVESFIQIYRPLIIIAFWVSVLNLVGYSVLAPWYKTPLGRILWTLFLANVLILLVPFLQVTYSDLPYRYEISIGTMIFWIIAFVLIGYGIYTAQIQGYLVYRNNLRKAKKLRKQQEGKQ